MCIWSRLEAQFGNPGGPSPNSPTTPRKQRQHHTHARRHPVFVSPHTHAHKGTHLVRAGPAVLTHALAASCDPFPQSYRPHSAARLPFSHFGHPRLWHFFALAPPPAPPTLAETPPYVAALLHTLVAVPHAHFQPIGRILGRAVAGFLFCTPHAPPHLRTFWPPPSRSKALHPRCNGSHMPYRAAAVLHARFELVWSTVGGVMAESTLFNSTCCHPTLPPFAPPSLPRLPQTLRSCFPVTCAC